MSRGKHNLVMLIIRSLTQRKTSNTGFIFTVRNEVAKVMFLHLSVCPQGGLPQCRDTPRADTPPPEQTPPNEQAPPGSRLPGSRNPPRSRHLFSPREQAPPPSRSRHPPGAGTRPPRDRHPPPRSRRLLLRTVHILLECILFISLYPPENMPAMNPPCFSNQERHHPKF